MGWSWSVSIGLVDDADVYLLNGGHYIISCETWAAEAQ
jgi:hypothetical protein